MIEGMRSTNSDERRLNPSTKVVLVETGHCRLFEATCKVEIGVRLKLSLKRLKRIVHLG